MTRENAFLDAIIERHVELPYLEFLPNAYDEHPANRWPLMLFLHGAGERGSDLDLVAKHGPPKRATGGEDFPFVLIAPQCPTNRWWHLILDDLHALVADVVERYRVDTTRIYLTGMSMGGFGTWHFAAEHPRTFAAIAPVCGGGDRRLGFPERVREIAHVPVWAFHGEADEVVPVDETVALMDELTKAGAADAKLTLYPGVGHDSWTETYENPDLYDWLLSKRNDRFGL